MESPTSTIPPGRQNDVPGQYSSLIIPQKGALSGQNGIAERTHLFFFSKKKMNWSKKDTLISTQVPLNFQVQLKKKNKNNKKSLSSPFYYFFMLLLEVFVFKSQWSRFTSSSTGTNKAESSLRRHWQLRIASESHSSSSLSLLSFPALFIAVVHCHPLFHNLDFCSIYQISSSSSPSHISVLLCFFVCP